MKVTMSSDKVNKGAINRKIANHGCMICPCCGENRDMLHNLCTNGKVEGIDLIGTITEYKGFFNIKIYHKDKYHCYTCGASWESDLY